jgi:5-formaminoimidazole-4-carboxamide-1-(beta)-D-ribofuranosyl 5'-monophosphate synthetase
MEGSPYSALLYGEPMSMGRRIARELAMAARSGRIGEVTT